MAMDRREEVRLWLNRIGKAKKKREQIEAEWDKNYKAIYGNKWWGFI